MSWEYLFFLDHNKKALEKTLESIFSDQQNALGKLHSNTSDEGVTKLAPLMLESTKNVTIVGA